MIYQFNCENCNDAFTVDVPMDDRNKPIDDPCPLCEKSGGIYRDWSSTSITYDTMDVQTRARKVAGSDFSEMMSRIHKNAGPQSRMDV